MCWPICNPDLDHLILVRFLRHSPWCWQVLVHSRPKNMWPVNHLTSSSLVWACTEVSSRTKELLFWCTLLQLTPVRRLWHQIFGCPPRSSSQGSMPSVQKITSIWSFSIHGSQLHKGNPINEEARYIAPFQGNYSLLFQ